MSQVYTNFYESLSGLREELHSTGRLDDSNAKLDEIIKILALYHSAYKGWIESDSMTALIKRGGKDRYLVRDLKRLFKQCAKLPQFRNSDGSSIFGPNPHINLQDTENQFVFSLIQSVNVGYKATLDSNRDGHKFDLLNESFGHFVRDNFRNNTEDAQYMTPPEVVDFMCRWAIHDILSEDPKAFNKEFLVADPSCGVGSFLASFYSHINAINALHNKNISLIGQDKVDRMVRLSKINLMLFDSVTNYVECGNSLIGSKFLNNFNGKVDLILTNPPFNAKFDSGKIANEPRNNFPLLSDIETLASKVDSELLFVDREMSLLKEGGRLLVVLPDSSISARGMPSILRERLTDIAEIKGIVELPAVTFAQAGTRTKTAILYLQKKPEPDHRKLCIVSKVNSLGYEVVMRKGVPVKRYEGNNDLAPLIEVIKRADLNNSKRGVLLDEPTCVLEHGTELIQNSWTPAHYSARKIKAEKSMAQDSGFEVRLLSDLANFETKQRRRLKNEPSSKCISVLHIIGDGFINFNDLMTYQPKTRGNVCFEGDVLFSKINPRIPRVLVVPKFDFPTVCSPEFEIIRAKPDIDRYWLAFVLQEQGVLDQIQSLTSGTSSSHNRIKANDLANVKIPVPKDELTRRKTEGRVKQYRRSIESLINGSLSIYNLRNLTA